MFQGHDGMDTDIPHAGEAAIFSTANRVGGILLKVVWVVGQLLFYAVRPLFVRPKVRRCSLTPRQPRLAQ
jgi:sphingolipid delta-4 desaturase